MFKLGQMFVEFVGRDGGLNRALKVADAAGKNLTSAYGQTVKEVGKVGVAGAKAFDRVGQAAAKAASNVARSCEKMTASASRAAGRIGPAFLRSFDKMGANVGKVLGSGLKSAGQIGGPMAKGLTEAGAAAVKGLGGGVMAAAGMVTRGAGSILKSFLAIRVGATATWAAVTGGLSLLLGVLGGGALGVAAVGMAGSFNEVKSKFDIVFGDSAPMAEKELGKLAAAMGRSKTDLIGMASGIQDLLVPIGFARDKAADMSVSISQLAVDMASFNNKSDTEVMDDISSALAGSGEVMKKYGIILNEVTLKQELSRMGYKGATEGASEQMKALARLNIIMAGSSDAHGDAVRTSASLSNQMKRIMGIVTDLAIKIGSVFVPAAEVFAKFFGDQLTAVNESADGLQSWADMFKGWAEMIVLNLQRVITLFINWKEISKAAAGVATAVFQASIDAIITLLDNAEAVLLAFFENVRGFFPNLASAIAETHGGIWSFLKKGWSEVWDFISSGGQNAIDLDLDKMMASLKKKMKSPEMKPFDTGGLSKAWGDLMGEVDKRLATAEKKAEGLNELKPFDPSALGIAIGGKAIKFEIVNAADLWKKNLEAAFDKDGKEAGLELQKKGVEAQVNMGKGIDKLVEDMPKLIEATKEGKPVVF